MTVPGLASPGLHHECYVATEMVRNNILRETHSGYADAVNSIPPGSEGLLMLPYLEGERVPPVSEGCGVFLGLRPASFTPAHMARAAMEGASLGLRYGFERFKSLGIETDEVRLTGGGAKSGAWRQILADLFGVSVVCPITRRDLPSARPCKPAGRRPGRHKGTCREKYIPG